HAMLSSSTTRQTNNKKTTTIIISSEPHVGKQVVFDTGSGRTKQTYSCSIAGRCAGTTYRSSTVVGERIVCELNISHSSLWKERDGIEGSRNKTTVFGGSTDKKTRDTQTRHTTLR